MRKEGVINVAGHTLLNKRCTRLPGCIRLRNDLYCVGWGVKIYSLTHLISCNTRGDCRTNNAWQIYNGRQYLTRPVVGC